MYTMGGYFMHGTKVKDHVLVSSPKQSESKDRTKGRSDHIFDRDVQLHMQHLSLDSSITWLV